MQWQGRQVIVHLHSARNYSGVKSTGESGALGDAGNQAYEKLVIPIRDIKGRARLSLEVMEASEKGQAGAAASALSEEMNRLTNDIIRQWNRQLFGFGEGTLAVIAAGVASATQDLKDAGKVVGTTNPRRYIQPNMKVAITDSTGATLRGVRTVNSITDFDTIVLDSSITTTTGDLVSLGTSVGSGESSFNKEMMGLLGIIDSSTFLATIFGLARSSKAFFQSGVKTSVGALSEDILYRSLHDQYEVSGELADRFFCHFSVLREYFKLTQADRRYTGADLRKPDAGVDINANLTFGEQAQWVADKDAPYGTLFGACSPHLFVIYENEGEWDKKHGGPLRFVADKTDYEAIYYILANVYADRGNCHFRLDGVSATVTSNLVAD